MELLTAILVIISITVVLPVALKIPGFYAQHLVKKALREIMTQEELSASLKDEAKALLEGKDNLSLVDWIEHNQDQFSGELLKMAQKAIRANKISKVYFVVLIVFIVMAVAIISD